MTLLLGFFANAAHAAEAAARVAVARGDVTARGPDGTTRKLAEGASVFSQDRISTGTRASVQLVFSDNTRFTLGEKAEMKLDEYQAGSDGTFVASVSKGVFRAITGLIATSRPQAVNVNMPVGTIGIRGTHFGGAADETSAVVVLLESEGRKATAIEVSNQFGAVVIDQPGFGTEIPDARSPPSPPRRMRLRAIDNLIRSLSVLPRR